MNNKTCTVCKIEKDINNFYKKYSKCKDSYTKRGVKRYYHNKENKSVQKKYIMKKVEIKI